MQDKYKILQSAERFVVNRKIAQAIEEYEKLLQREEDEPTLLNTVGDLLLREDQREKALGYFHRVAEIYLQTGFTPRAIATYKKIHTLNPSDFKVNGVLADLYEKQGLNLDATRHLAFLLEHFEKRGEVEQILETVERLVESNQGVPSERLKYVPVLVDRGATARAVEYCLESARLFREAGKPEKAFDALFENASIDPDNREILKLLVETGEDCQRLSEVEEYLQQRIQEPESPASSQMFLAWAFEKQGRVDEANALFQALENDGNSDPFVLDGLQRTGRKGGDPTDPLESLIEEGPTSGMGLEFELGDEDSSPEESEPEGSQPQFSLDSSNGHRASEELQESGPGFDSSETVYFDREQTAASKISEDETPTAEELLLQEDETSAISDTETLDEELAVEAEDSTTVSSLEESLEEADFYLKLGFRDEAKKLLKVLIAKHPSDERVLRRADKVMLTPPKEGADLGGSGDDDDGFELAIDTALDSLFTGGLDEDPQDEVLRYDVAASTKGKDNPKVHYDLGLAYKEMGLLNDAIQEFLVSFDLFQDDGQNPQKILCCSMLANSYLQLESYEDAITWAEEGLAMPDKKEFEWKALQYDLAFAQQQKGETESALSGYRAILAKDPEYRDVMERSDELASERDGE